MTTMCRSGLIGRATAWSDPAAAAADSSCASIATSTGTQIHRTGRGRPAPRSGGEYDRNKGSSLTLFSPVRVGSPPSLLRAVPDTLRLDLAGGLGRPGGASVL